MIQIQTSHGSCPIRFEQPSKLTGPSGCVSYSRSGYLIFLSSQSVNRLTVEQLTLGVTPDGSLKVYGVAL